jgi:hypothetical protein
MLRLLLIRINYLPFLACRLTRGFRIQDLEFGIWSLEFGVWNLLRIKLGQKEKLRLPKAFQQTTTN